LTEGKEGRSSEPRTKHGEEWEKKIKMML